MTVRITVLFRRKASISLEEFHKYWSEQHPKIFLSVPIVREKLTRYSQFHVNAQATEMFAAQGVASSGWDGAAEFWAESLEDVAAVFHDDEYLRVIVPDEMGFLDREGATFMVGHDEVKWDGGKVVDEK